MKTASDGRVVIDTHLNNAGFKKGVNQISGSLGGLKSVAGKIGGILAAAFAVQKVVQFGAACVQLGSDVAEVQNVVDTAFGGMAYKMEEFADTAITQFGMSQLAAKKTGSTYMAMARSMGVAEDAASDMAIALTKLSGDVASFFNLDQETAAYKLQSIFTGETEALKDLGVVMTQVNLQQYAMANGMNSNIQAMTQAERVALQYSFVLDSLKLAQGDFLRTQDSWANQTRILSMQWQQFMSIIGQALTTVLLPVVKILNTIVAALINVANGFNAAVQAIFGGTKKQVKQSIDAAGGLAAANSGIGGSAMDAAKQEDKLANSTKKAGKAAKGALAAFDQLNVLQQDTGSGASGGAGAGTNAGAGGAVAGSFETVTESGEEVPPLLQKISAIVQQLKAILEPSIAAWANAFLSLREPIENAFSVVSESTSELLTEHLKPLADYVLGQFIPNIVNEFSQTFAPIFADVMTIAVMDWAKNFKLACEIVGDATDSLVLPGLQTIQGVAIDMLESISNAWALYGQPILTAWSTAMDTIRGIISKVYYETVKPILEMLMTKISNLWDEHFKPLWDNLVLFFAAFAEMILAIWNGYILPWIQRMTDTFGPVIVGVVDWISETFTVAAGIIADVLSGIMRALRGLCDFVTGVFTGDWNKAWDGVKNIFLGIWDAIASALKGVVNRVIGFVNGMISAVCSGINAVVNLLNKLSFDVPDWVPGIGGEKFGFSIDTITPPKIPYLAQGAVLPANKPFLAMVGDQKHGTNVEAPLATIQQALVEALAQSGGQDITIKFAASGGLEQLVRLLKPYIDRENNRTGARLITGGAY